MAGLNKMKVLITEVMDDIVIEILQKHCQVDTNYKWTRAEILNIIPEYDGLIIRGHIDIDKEFLDRATKLKIVGRCGAGVDNIDVAYAAEKGIIVANTPEGNTISAAEHAIALLLAISRNIAWASDYIKSGKWGRKLFLGNELYQKVLGIIGLGRIGSAVARRMQGFDLKKIAAYDPYIPDSRFKECGVEKKATLEELIKEADFITIHTPKTAETTNMISEKEIALMKDGVRLVNAARGGLYNEDALYKGLKSGKIASVAIDVWVKEPQEAHPLYEFPNVTGTPHLGASTHEAQLRVGEEIALAVLAGLKGEPVKNAVDVSTLWV